MVTEVAMSSLGVLWDLRDVKRILERGRGLVPRVFVKRWN